MGSVSNSRLEIAPHPLVVNLHLIVVVPSFALLDLTAVHSVVSLKYGNRLEGVATKVILAVIFGHLVARQVYL